MNRPLGLARSSAGQPEPLLGAPVHYLHSGSQPMSELETESLAAHRARFGLRPSCLGEGGHALLRRLDGAALSGRGGGHFPVAAKWRRVQAARMANGGGTVVVANGAEGEPLSRKDAALLELRPHLVLDGLVSAAEALGADDAVLWLHDDAHTARAAVTRALAERTGDEPRVRVAVAPSHYLSGESSAVVSALSGGPALPGFTRVPAAERGVGGRPTLVQNVETLARVALIARDADPGTVLLTVADGEQLVVVEHAERTTLRDAVTATVGGTAPGALLLGGYGGRWLDWDHAAGLTLRESELRARGLSTGAGVVAPLAAGDCGLVRTAEIATYLAAASARQCGPCTFGLPAIAAILGELADTRASRRDSRRLDRFLAEVAGRGGCHHPDGAVGLVRSALLTFADDVHAHRRRRCIHQRPAGRRGPGARHG